MLNKESDSNVIFNVEQLVPATNQQPVPATDQQPVQSTQHLVTPQKRKVECSLKLSKKQKKNDVDAIILDTLNEMDQNVRDSISKNEHNKNVEKDSETSLFCNSLVDRIDRLPPRKRYKARLEIEKLLFETVKLSANKKFSEVIIIYYLKTKRFL